MTANAMLILLDPMSETLGGSVRKVAAEFPDVAVNTCKFDQLGPTMKSASLGMIVAHITERKDGLQLVQLLKVIRNLVISEKWVVLVITPFKQNVFKEKLLKYGCAEVLIEPIHEKSLQFKIKRYVQVLASRVKPKADKKADAGKKQKSGPAPVEATPKEKAKRSHWSQGLDRGQSPKIEWLPALNVPEDCWLILGGSARHVNTRWVIRLMGPPRYLGTWVERSSTDAPTDARTEERSWVWTPSPSGLQENPSGQWEFRGERPKVHEGLWKFTGAKPELSYVAAGAIQLQKFFLRNEHELMITRDGSSAKDIRQRFQEAEQAGATAAAESSMPVESPEPEAQAAEKEADAAEVPGATVFNFDEIEPEPSVPAEPDLVEIEAKIMTRVQKVLATEETDSLEALRKAVQPIPQAQNLTEAPQRSPERVLEWIIKKDVEGPSVSVAGFIFLLSEWISKPGMQHGECMARICQYLGASLGRARVELWAEQQGAWDVVGSNRTSDHEPYSVSPDQIEALLIDTKDRAQTKAVEFKTMGTGVRCALVVSGQRVAHPSVHDYLSKIRTVLPGAMSGLASE